MLSGATRRAAKGRLPWETARRWMSRHASRFDFIWAAVGGVRGGKRRGRAEWAALEVRASVALDVVSSDVAILARE